MNVGNMYFALVFFVMAISLETSLLLFMGLIASIYFFVFK